MLDDRFLKGIYYELESGDFVSFGRDEEAEEVIFYDETGERELDRISFAEFDPDNYRQVTETAVEDPVEVFEKNVDHFFEKVVGGRGIPMSVEIAFRYAREHVEVSEAKS